MTKEEIIKYAAGGQMPNREMTCPERALFYALKDIYTRFRQGIITKEQGESQKNLALRQFALDNSAILSAMKILRQNAEMWKEIELAGNHYHMDRTLENADAFIEAVYRTKLKHEGDG